jgi:hypothetical protein
MGSGFMDAATSGINYVPGDLLKLLPKTGSILIPQIVNDAGFYGAGLSGAIARVFPVVEKEYREWVKVKNSVLYNEFRLGATQFLIGEANSIRKISIANMVAQHNVVPVEPVPIRYPALRECMERVAGFCKNYGYSIHTGKFGCGLAGGTWDRVSEMVNGIWVNRGIDVFVYEL